METKDYLNYVVREIHRTIVATVDDEGLPSHLVELRRRQKDISSRTAVSDAEAVWQYVRRAASDRTVFRSRLSRNTACTVEIA